MQLVGRVASIVGRQHMDISLKTVGSQPPLMVTKLSNRQDMTGVHFVNNGGVLEVAFAIHDGSSDGETTEVGAGLLAQTACVQLALLVNKYGIDSPEVEFEMYAWYLRAIRAAITVHPFGELYLSCLDGERERGILMDIDSSAELTTVYNWIKQNFQFCIVLGYFSPEGLRTLQRGDGGYYVDGEIITSQYDDVPPYIGYHFYPDSKINAGIHRLQGEGKNVKIPPPGFESRFFPQAEAIAGFSDGMPLGKLEPKLWELLVSPYSWGEVRNKLEVRARSWWQEYVTPDLPSDGWLISDDMTLAAFRYEGRFTLAKTMLESLPEVKE